MLVAELNIVINCAACLDFEQRLDIATRINTTGPLKLLELAAECPKVECFV